METVFTCPTCGRQAIGIIKRGCASVCICPNCKKEGSVVYMLEETKVDIRNMGDGLYTKNK